MLVSKSVFRVALAFVATPFSLCPIAFLGLPLSAILFPKSGASGFFFFLLLSPMQALPITLFFGIPTYLVARLFGRVGFWRCLLVGIFSAVAATSIGRQVNIWTILTTSKDVWTDFLAFGYPMFIAFGVTYGAIFWFLAFAENWPGDKNRL